MEYILKCLCSIRKLMTLIIIAYFHLTIRAAFNSNHISEYYYDISSLYNSV